MSKPTFDCAFGDEGLMTQVITQYCGVEDLVSLREVLTVVKKGVDKNVTRPHDFVKKFLDMMRTARHSPDVHQRNLFLFMEYSENMDLYGGAHMCNNVLKTRFVICFGQTPRSLSVNFHRLKLGCSDNNIPLKHFLWTSWVLRRQRRVDHHENDARFLQAENASEMMHTAHDLTKKLASLFDTSAAKITAEVKERGYNGFSFPYP